MNRRGFLKLGSLFVPVVAAPTVAYSFLWKVEQKSRLVYDLNLEGTTLRTNYTILEYGTRKVLAKGTIHHPNGLGDGVMVGDGVMGIGARLISIPIGVPIDALATLHAVRETRYGQK